MSKRIEKKLIYKTLSAKCAYSFTAEKAAWQDQVQLNIAIRFYLVELYMLRQIYVSTRFMQGLHVP